MSDLPDLPRYTAQRAPRRRLAPIIAAASIVAAVALGWYLFKPDSSVPHVDPALPAQTMLRDALATAREYYKQNDTLLGFSATRAHRTEPSITFNRSSEASEGQVSIRDVGPSTVLLVTLDAEGEAWCSAKTLLGDATGRGDVATAAECKGGW